MITYLVFSCLLSSVLTTHRVYLGPSVKNKNAETIFSLQRLPPECSEYTSTIISGGNTAIAPIEGDHDGILAIATSSLTIDIYNKSQSKLHSFLLTHQGNVTAIVQLNKSSHLVTTSLDSTALVLDFETGNFINQFNNHTGALRSVAYLNSLNLVVTGGDDQILYFWVPETGEIRGNMTIGSEINSMKVIERHNASILALATNSGVKYVEVSREGKLQFYGQHKTTGFVHSLEYIQGTKFIAVLKPLGKIAFYDVSHPEEAQPFLSNNISSSLKENTQGELIYIESKHVLFYAQYSGKLYSWKLIEKPADSATGKPATIELIPFQTFGIPRQDVSIGRAVYIAKSFELFLLLKNGIYKYNFKNFETVNFYGECYRECPEGFFPDEFKNCKKCSKDCQSCSKKADYCLICHNNLYQIDGVCINDCPKNSELISVKNRTCKCLEDYQPTKGVCIEEDDFPADRENFLAWMVGSVIVGFLCMSLCLYCIFMFYEQKRHPLPKFESNTNEEDASHGSIAQESDRGNEEERKENDFPGNNDDNLKSEPLRYERHDTLFRSPEKPEEPKPVEWCFPTKPNSNSKRSPSPN